MKTGLQGENGQIAVTQGLFEGEQVVTSAQFMLDSESKLREAIQKMLNPTRAESPEKILTIKWMISLVMIIKRSKMLPKTCSTNRPTPV